jgi:hypothetical protein
MPMAKGGQQLRHLPECKKCPSGYASGPDAPHPAHVGGRAAGHASWTVRRTTRNGAVCVQCPSKQSNVERTRCVVESGGGSGGSSSESNNKQYDDPKNNKE